jgi:NADPH2:quinone reductase
MLHRPPRSNRASVLFHGASRGVGTALLQLGRSRRTGDAALLFIARARRFRAGRCPNRLPESGLREGNSPPHERGRGRRLRPIGGAHLWHSREALRPGGRVVGYGNTTSLRGEGLGSDRTGRRNRLHGISPSTQFVHRRLGFSGRKRIVPYSIQTLKRLKPALFRRI